jgi:NAD(P)-dependent dehydrogenase (short-subunit alcohol dehydrogenase family)
MTSRTRPVALVTGASRGIGRGVALALGGIGHDVAVNYVRDEAAAKDVCESLAEIGVRGHPVQADIAVTEDRARLVDEVYDTFGRLDLLVNNAGVGPRVRADILEASEESFDHLVGVNLRGPYFLTQLVANRMIAQLGTDAGGPAPKIVIVSSISAYTASTNRGDYCVAKAGLAMTATLYAARLAEYGINVYEIRPGIIDTDMTGPVRERYDDLIHNQGITPIRRWGLPDDVGRAVVAVAQDLLPFSTGQVIDVDGGFHLRRL